MDRKRKLTIFYSARHKRRLISKRTFRDIEMITHETENSTVISNNYPLNDNEPDNASICDPQVVNLDTNLNQSVNEDDNTDVAQYYFNTDNNEVIIDNPTLNNYENTSDSIDDKAFMHDISTWAIHENISHKSLNQLLQILRKYTNYVLPKDARTLLRTPQSTKIIQIDGGEYSHLGLKKALLNIIKKHERLNFIPDVIKLFINIDGLPIYKSSEKSLWPILCSDRIINNVYVIGVYYGEGKPKSANEFLKMFVDEAIDIISNKIDYKEQVIKVEIEGIICDAPAKSFVLCIKGHNGYNSCTKCLIEGQNIEGRVCFPFVSDIILRTDEEFSTNSYSFDYQTGNTILKNIPNLGLITNVPLDYMHLVCLGVMRKLIILWLSGPLNIRLSNYSREKISMKLIKLRKSVPSNFARRPRSLKYVKHWKEPLNIGSFYYTQVRLY